MRGPAAMHASGKKPHPVDYFLNHACDDAAPTGVSDAQHPAARHDDRSTVSSLHRKHRSSSTCDRAVRAGSGSPARTIDYHHAVTVLLTQPSPSTTHKSLSPPLETLRIGGRRRTADAEVAEGAIGEANPHDPALTCGQQPLDCTWQDYRRNSGTSNSSSRSMLSPTAVSEP